MSGDKPFDEIEWRFTTPDARIKLKNFTRYWEAVEALIPYSQARKSPLSPRGWLYFFGRLTVRPRIRSD